MPRPNKRKKHTTSMNERRSKESLATKDSEQSGSEEDVMIKIDDNIDDDIDDINFEDPSVLNDISDLFSFCKQQINTRFISTLVYMSLRHFGHSWRETDDFMKEIGAMTAKTSNKWAHVLVNSDLDEFTTDERGIVCADTLNLLMKRLSISFCRGKRGDSFWDNYRDLELEAKDFVFTECSKKESSFTAEKLAKFIDDRFYELTKLNKNTQQLVRSIESCKLDLRRFGAKYTAGRHDESTYKSGEISAKRWIMTDNAPFYNKGKGKSVMSSDFLVMHPSSPFFTLTDKEFEKALKKYPDLNDNGLNLNYEQNSASATMNVEGDNYMDNPIVLSQFERTFKLLPFKNEYKKHHFVFLVNNARTHTAAEYTVSDFALYPDGRCPVDNIDFLDENNIKQTIEYYDNQGISKGLLALAHELNLFDTKQM
ncbi:unnamed protein product [Didymodactylos carnosus]|uniref:Uncharacterized protein n=1 Tax=Didymodactylos carnosus TaxID=1234261 RepID=A0A8S2U3Z4_9BILA|nr:unnamed protein product [Didymodactylos carnosus]CAF4471965.1 unnamed protein product [Didymodactylos carnosus]